MNNYNQCLIPITNDLFDIAARLKSVNADYVLYYNAVGLRYEVHDRSGLAFAVPYDELDARTVEYAYETSVQNADEIFAEIERSNDIITKNKIRSIAEDTAYRLKSKEKK